MDQDFCLQNQQLINEGFFRVSKNYKILKMVGGDLEFARKMLNLKQKKKSNVEKLQGKAQEEQHYLKLIEMNNFVEQHQELVSQGFKCFDKNLYLLLKHKGNLRKVEKKLKKSYSKKDYPEMSGLTIDEKKNKLKEMGFNNEDLNIQILNQKSGNLEKTIKVLTRKQQEDNTYPLLIEIKKQKEILDQKLNLISQEGFTKKSQALKLLALCNGDVQKTLEIFRLKEQIHKENKVKKMQQDD